MAPKQQPRFTHDSGGLLFPASYRETRGQSSHRQQTKKSGGKGLTGKMSLTTHDFTGSVKVIPNYHLHLPLRNILCISCGSRFVKCCLPRHHFSCSSSAIRTGEPLSHDHLHRVEVVPLWEKIYNLRKGPNCQISVDPIRKLSTCIRHLLDISFILFIPPFWNICIPCSVPTFFPFSVVQDASQPSILHNRNRLEAALSGLPQSWETHTGEVP